MAAAIRNTHPDATIEMIRGGGGNFIVIADGQQLWHKHEMDNEFPENDAILAKL